jgi:signal transduction histidine kinase
MLSAQAHPDRSAVRRSTRLSTMLIGAFVLTVACFLTSSILSERRARGIEEAADEIVMDAVPSIDHLSRARTELRHMEVLLDDLADSGSEVLASRLAEARRTFATEYAAYRDLPPFDGEEALWARLESSTAEMNRAIDAIVHKVQLGEIAPEELGRLAKPAIDRVDHELVEGIDLNGHKTAELSATIDQLRVAGHSLSHVLDALSLVFAAIATALVLRMVRRHTSLIEERAAEMEQFAGRVAHDIRSPLQAVTLALDLAKMREPALEPRTRTILDRALLALRRVGQLVDGLLLFAAAGKVRPGRGGAKVDDVIAGVSEEMRPAAEEKEIELRVERSEGLEVACDPGVLVSLVSNLLGNAIKHMGDAPVRLVELRVRSTPRSVRIEVADTGPGTPPEVRRKIFEPYVRATTSTVPGIGLGLATVRRLAEAHGGTVGVDANPGGGSVFWFQLPRASRLTSLPPAQRGLVGSLQLSKTP